MKILELAIFTKDPEAAKRFYTKTLGIGLAKEKRHSFTIQAGFSALSFIQKDDVSPYHFAFTIPSNQEAEALAWLKKRVEILKYGEDEIVDFSHWNAKSIYFYDPDKNIVEFIARKNLPYTSSQNFAGNSLVEISEIGMPVDDIENFYRLLYGKYRIEIFDGNFNKFCAVGDERGLFIVINKRRKNWFPTDDAAFSSAFHIKMENNNVVSTFRFENNLIYVDI